MGKRLKKYLAEILCISIVVAMFPNDFSGFITAWAYNNTIPEERTYSANEERTKATSDEAEKEQNTEKPYDKEATPAEAMVKANSDFQIEGTTLVRYTGMLKKLLFRLVLKL